jgi:fermentation-respiration switch protein FrsA (DUF1100 family)
MESMRSYYPAAHIHHISPTPLLMTIAINDLVTPPRLALEEYSRALEPKQLSLLDGGHYDSYSGPVFDTNVARQADFLREKLCKVRSSR